MSALTLDLDPLARDLFRAATLDGRLDAPAAQIFADYLDEAGDDRGGVVRGLATATLTRVANAYEVSRGSRLTACWSVNGREVRIGIWAPSTCLPVFTEGTVKLVDEVVARVSKDDGPRTPGRVRYIVRRLTSHNDDGIWRLMEDGPAMYFGVPKGASSENLGVSGVQKRQRLLGGRLVHESENLAGTYGMRSPMDERTLRRFSLASNRRSLLPGFSPGHLPA
jgi:hypothetical protein